MEEGNVLLLGGKGGRQQALLGLFRDWVVPDALPGPQDNRRLYRSHHSLAYLSGVPACSIICRYDFAYEFMEAAIADRDPVKVTHPIVPLTWSEPR